MLRFSFLSLLAAALFAPAVLVWAQSEPSSGSGEAARPAYYLQQGSIARSRIVALGRDMRVEGEALSHAVVLSGNMFIRGRVEGDVIVIDGAAHLAETAHVGGDVYVLGGRIETAPGASIGGRSVAYPDASSLWVGLIQGPTLGLPAYSPTVIGAKLALLAFWAFLILLLLSVGRREILETADSIRKEPFRNFIVGLVGVLAMLLTALFMSAFSGAILGLPLLVLVMVIALSLRFWGMVAIFLAVGEVLFRLLKRRAPWPLHTACYGLLVLGVVKFIPALGVWVWSLATFIGVGATLVTKFGRKEPWLESLPATR